MLGSRDARQKNCSSSSYRNHLFNARVSFSIFCQVYTEKKCRCIGSVGESERILSIRCYWNWYLSYSNDVYSVLVSIPSPSRRKKNVLQLRRSQIRVGRFYRYNSVFFFQCVINEKWRKNVSQVLISNDYEVPPRSQSSFILERVCGSHVRVLKYNMHAAIDFGTFRPLCAMSSLVANATGEMRSYAARVRLQDAWFLQ